MGFDSFNLSEPLIFLRFVPSTGVMSTHSRVRTLVTGGAGFIGSHLVRRLLNEGHRVRVVDNLSTGFRANLDEVSGDIEFVEGDLCDPATCQRVVDGIDLVFHVAALPSVPRSLENPIACHRNNVDATLFVLEASRKAGVRRVVYSSSSSVYGDTAVLPKTEEVEPLPRSPYATAKLAGEQYTLAYARAGLVEGVALRYFNVFGPRQDPNGPYAAVIPMFLRSAATGASVPLFGDGEQTRDFTFVANVVDANMLAGFGETERVNGWAVNVGAGGRSTLNELIAAVQTITGKRVIVERRPPRGGDVRDSMAGLTRTRRILGYEPQVSLPQGLGITWEWMLDTAGTSLR